MSALARVLDATTALVRENPALAAFSPWPEAPEPSEREPVDVPAISHLAVDFQGDELPSEHAELLAAVVAASRDIEWRRSYTEEQVGADFLQRYGYFELLGPTGHYIDHATRAYLGYWGPELYYPWHTHQAEELYFVVAGSAEFEFGDGRAKRSVGETQMHTSYEPHAMRTTACGGGILNLVLWRGEGLSGLPTMTSTTA